jgi:FdhD protein
VADQLLDGSNRFTTHQWSEQAGWVQSAWKPAGEIALSIYLDRKELVTLLCTPEKLNALIVGFLRSEGLIDRLEDIALMRVCEEEGIADVRLTTPRDVIGTRMLTSGCGGGVTFDDVPSIAPVVSEFRWNPALVISSMKKLLHPEGENRKKGGLHLAALSDGESLLLVSRDVGRHNTLDKIHGEALLRGINTSDKLLLTTGRISSEMVTKAAKMGIPVAASVNSPTDRAVLLAEKLGIAIVGYVRSTRLSVYSHPERLRT